MKILAIESLMLHRSIFALQYSIYGHPPSLHEWYSCNYHQLQLQGYTKDQPGQNNLYVNVIDDLQQIAENVGSKTYYHSFGKAIKPIKENKIAQVIKPGFYECTEAASECNNQESKIHLPFKMAKANPGGTYIIVTDLFYAFYWKLKTKLFLREL